MHSLDVFAFKFYLVLSDKAYFFHVGKPGGNGWILGFYELMVVYLSRRFLTVFEAEDGHDIEYLVVHHEVSRTLVCSCDVKGLSTYIDSSVVATG